MEQVYLKSREEWRDWLRLHHDTSSGIWLVCYKKHTGKSSLEYDAIVEEALCFGWIDSIIKGIDDERYLRKLTPRKPQSRWSDSNKRRVSRLEKDGLTAAAGIARVQEARASGVWDRPDRPPDSSVMPRELERALSQNAKARRFFDQLAPSYRKQFIGWIGDAKREETRARRAEEAVSLLERGQKLSGK